MKTTIHFLSIAIIGVLFGAFFLYFQIASKEKVSPNNTHLVISNPKIPPALSLADSLLAKGEAAFNDRSYETAHQLFTKGDSLFQLVKKDTLAFQAKVRAAKALYKANKRGKAKGALETAILWAKAQKLENTLVMADAYHDLGVCYANAKDGHIKQNKKKAIKYYKEELQLRTSLNDPDKNKIVQVSKNIGERYFWMDQLDSANIITTKTIQFINENFTLIHPKLKAQVYHLNGRLLYNKKDLFQAKQHFKLAKTYYEIDSNSTLQQKSQLLNEFALALKQLKDFSEALEIINSAIKLREKKEPKGSRDLIGLASYFDTKGLIYKDMKSYPDAETQFFKSVAINKKLKNRESALVNNYNNLSIVYKHQQKYQQAKQVLYDAIEINRSLHSYSTLAKNYDNLGDIHFEQDQYQQAIDAYDISIGLFATEEEKKVNIKKHGLERLKYKHETLIPLASKAKAYLKLSEKESDHWLDSAYQTVLTIEDLIDHIRQDYALDDSKVSLVEKTKPIYETAIEICLQLCENTPNPQYYQKAFELSEKSKSIILLEGIRNLKAKQFNIPDTLLQQERNLKLAIHRFEDQLRQTPKADLENTVLFQDNLLQSRNKLQALIDHFEANFSNYYQLKYDLNLPSVAQLQSDLSPERAIVEYFYGDSHLYAFVISKKDYYFSKLANDQIKHSVDALQLGMMGRSDPELGINPAGADSLLSIYSYQLYQQLIEPLRLAEQIKYLTIIPDDILGYTPFDALTTQQHPPGKEDFENAQYLKDRFIISYNYSTAIMQESHQKKATATPKKGILGFATAQDTAILVKESSTDSVFFPAADFENELRKISKKFSGKYFYGQKANLDNFERYLQSFNVIHFAGHGNVNDKDSKYSFLLLMPQEKGNRDEPFVFYVRDFYALDLNSDLIVFTACETANGAINQGEGIISLARATFYAGTKSLITSLWALHPDEKSEVIYNFYENIDQGEAKDKALWLAKEKFLKGKTGTKAHPYFWAPLVPFGNIENIELPKKKGFFSCSRN